MNALTGLYRYLTDAETLTGHAGERFTYTSTIGGIKIRTRNEAREAIRERVGKSVYLGRRPQMAGTHSAIELQLIGENPDYGLVGEAPGVESLIQATVYCRKGDASYRAMVIADLLRMAVSGYHGATWGDLHIGECLIESRSVTPIPPPDASDDWTYTVITDLRVMASPPAPIMPHTPLLALFA